MKYNERTGEYEYYTSREDRLIRPKHEAILGRAVKKLLVNVPWINPINGEDLSRAVKWFAIRNIIESCKIGGMNGDVWLKQVAPDATDKEIWDMMHRLLPDQRKYNIILNHSRR